MASNLLFTSLIILSILFINHTDARANYAITPKVQKKFFGGLIPRLPFPPSIRNPQTPPDGDEDAPVEEPITNPLGSWELHSENARVSAMQIQLMPKSNKIVWYDSTSNGLSEIELNPRSCRPRSGGRKNDPEQDCSAHAIEYDHETAEIRTLEVETSPWCSSGGLSPDGALISTGGIADGYRSMRILKRCSDCQFQENPNALFSNRWYATQHALEDGSFVVIGGRDAYNYEIVPSNSLEFEPKLTELPLLRETSDDGGRENNLYPFVNLLPDGNLFVFANYKSVILNPNSGEVVRKLPDLGGGSRNYPPSGMSALLPIDLNKDDVEIEVLVCGGNTRDSYTLSDLQRPNRTFLPASTDCGRIRLDLENPKWEHEDMPSPRVMGDMLLLPNGNVLMINGAKTGTSAWNAAAEPNLTPVLYDPNKVKGERFTELAPSTIPRMYHSVSAVLPDGKVLVAGSNTNPFYMLDKYNDEYTFPTELRVEKFSPPYLVDGSEADRVEISEEGSDTELRYGEEFKVEFDVSDEGGGEFDEEEVKVTMYSPPFTTHGYSMNQRLLILKTKKVTVTYARVVAPPSGKIAPPGFYLLFVVHKNVPSRGVWVRIQ